MVNKMITSLWRAASRSVSRSRAASIPSTAEQYPKFKTISTPKKTTRTTSTHGGSAPMTVLPAEPLAVRRKVPPLLPLSPFAPPPLSLGTQSLSLLRTPRWPPGGSQARDREEGASGEETPSQARSGGSPPAGLEEKGCTTLRRGGRSPHLREHRSCLRGWGSCGCTDVVFLPTVCYSRPRVSVLDTRGRGGRCWRPCLGPGRRENRDHHTEPSRGGCAGSTLDVFTRFGNGSLAHWPTPWLLDPDAVVALPGCTDFDVLARRPRSSGRAKLRPTVHEAAAGYHSGA
jgi:hypothetical protein